MSDPASVWAFVGTDFLVSWAGLGVYELSWPSAWVGYLSVGWCVALSVVSVGPFRAT